MGRLCGRSGAATKPFLPLVSLMNAGKKPFSHESVFLFCFIFQNKVLTGKLEFSAKECDAGECDEILFAIDSRWEG